jgi:hypothetical protein
VSEVRNLYINEKGELVLKKDLLKSLHLPDNKVECIVDSNQIILRNPVSVVEQLLGCCGEESKDDYDFHIEFGYIIHQ